MNNGVSVCITAYKAKDFIKDCLDSIEQQTWFKTHNDWEIIIGIDGCEETLKYLKTIINNYRNLRVFMMDSNKGTYITSNTIISNAKYENIFRFDADDLMLPNLIETIMNKKDEYDFIRYRFLDFYDINNINKKANRGLAHGTIYIKKSLFLKYGGFRPWVCGADTEIYERLKNIENIKDLSDILMLRRVHQDSLTHDENTGMKSKLREHYKKLISELDIKTKDDAKIECIVNTYKEIFSNILNKKISNENQEDKKILLEKIKLFSNNIKNEKKPKSKIDQLRKDIRNGNVFSVYMGDGKFGWKRI